MENTKEKKGIALVVTLGFLSVMIILAISFSTFMRTERKVAAGSIQLVQSDLAALGALNRIIYDINYQSRWSTNGLFPTNLCSTNATSGESTGFQCETILSDSKSGGRYFLNDAVKENLSLPDEPAFGSGKVTPEWYLLTTNFLEVGVLYSFVIVNESGLLDINAFSTNWPDSVSTNYPVYDLPYLSAVTDNNAFFSKKKGEYLYLYAQPEIDDFVDSVGADRNNHFTAYLPFVQKGELGGAYTNRIVLGTNTTLAELTPALVQAGIVNAAQAYDNVMDYMDEDRFSRNPPLGYGSEAVPMINEIGTRSRIVRTGSTNFNIHCDVFVELWYPFLNTFTNEFILRPDITAVSMDFGAGAVAVPYSSPSTNFYQTFSWTNDQLLTVVFSNVVHNYTYTPVLVPGTNMGNLVVELTPVLTNSGTGVGIYDLAPLLTITNYSMPRPDVDETNNGPVASLSIDDPRYNGVGTNWFIATQTMYPLPSTNMYKQPPPADALPFYIADGEINHVGELGLVGTGLAQWDSISIIGVHSNLLDTITTHTNYYVRGPINIHADKPVWILGINALNQRFTDFLTDTNNKSPIYMSDTHLSNFTNNFPGFAAETRSALASYLTNKWVMANSSDFYDINGNAFTVIIAVKTFRDLSPNSTISNHKYDGPDVDPDLAKNFLVAQLWRDPVSKETKLTFLKWQRRTD